jgi:acetolactate decarboxylase
LPALSLGLYDGELTFNELLQHGNFGIGTFNSLDGELVILDGKAWRVRSDGNVSRVNGKTLTPFAAVVNFAPNQVSRVWQNTEYSTLQKQLSQILPSPNLPYAIAIRGTFSRIKVRSVPTQTKPYRPLAEVVKSQSVWEWKNIRGTLVGFRFPSYLSGVNLADFHFHFISDDKTLGGHLLDCTLQRGQIEVQSLRGFDMVLPESKEFDAANLSGDHEADLKKAETGR